MATEEEQEKSGEPSAAEETQLEVTTSEVVAGDEEDGLAPAQLGTTKYVQGAFFAAGVLVAYISGNILAAIWSTLAEWPTAVDAIPQLLAYAEDERPTFTMSIGAVIGVLAVVYAARRQDIRSWADEVAVELYKVHWPEREVVTNGTVVVIVAGVFATLYVGLLDRFWGFVTNLVYGAA